MQRRRQFEGLKQKKSLGQVFLREDWPCRKITEFLIQQGVKSVLEIGPGGGALTGELLASGFSVAAVEKDQRFADKLSDYWAANRSFEIHREDILRFDLKQWIDQTPGPKAICGNVPYNISSAILHRLLPHLGDVKGMIFMFQEEFALRAASRYGTKSYGSLSVFCQLRARTNLEFKVPRFCFQPVPKVDSAVVSFLPPFEKKSPEELSQIESITRMAFSQRRKKLSNSLSTILKGIDDSRVPVDLDRRCETLSPEEFANLAEFFSAEGK